MFLHLHSTKNYTQTRRPAVAQLNCPRRARTYYNLRFLGNRILYNKGARITRTHSNSRTGVRLRYLSFCTIFFANIRLLCAHGVTTHVFIVFRTRKKRTHTTDRTHFFSHHSPLALTLFVILARFKGLNIRTHTYTLIIEFARTFLIL